MKRYAQIMLGLSLAIGCSSTTQGEKMVQSYARTKETVAETRAQVDATLIALNGLRNTPGDQMKSAFRYYKEAVEDLEKEGESAKWRATSMKGQSDEHIRAWQEEMKSINDPAIKSSLQSRQDAVRTNFKLIRLYADDIKKAWDPFLKGNKDIVQALSIDLSPATINSLAAPIDRVLADGAKLGQSLAAIQLALNNMANGVSPIGLPD